MSGTVNTNNPASGRMKYCGAVFYLEHARNVVLLLS